MVYRGVLLVIYGYGGSESITVVNVLIAYHWCQHEAISYLKIFCVTDKCGTF